MDPYLLTIESASDLRSINKLFSADYYISVSCSTAPECVCFETPTIASTNPCYNVCFLLLIPKSVAPRLKLTAAAKNKNNTVVVGEASIDLQAETKETPEHWVTIDSVLGGEMASGKLTVSLKKYSQNPKINIVGATDLKNADGFFDKSDPFGEVRGGLNPGKIWGSTNTIDDDLNPVFAAESPIILNFLEIMPLGGKLVPIQIGIRDQDKTSSDPLGHVVLSDWKKVFPDPNTMFVEEAELKGPGSKWKKTNRVTFTLGNEKETISDEAALEARNAMLAKLLEKNKTTLSPPPPPTATGTSSSASEDVERGSGHDEAALLQLQRGGSGVGANDDGSAEPSEQEGMESVLQSLSLEEDQGNISSVSPTGGASEESASLVQDTMSEE